MSQATHDHDSDSEDAMSFDRRLSRDVPQVEVVTDTDEEAQLGAFANATLGYTRDGKWAVSVATYVDLPPGLTQAEVKAQVQAALDMAAAASPIVMFDAQIGKSFEYDTVLDEERRALELEEVDDDEEDQ